jgi:AAA ATPase domain
MGLNVLDTILDASSAKHTARCEALGRFVRDRQVFVFRPRMRAMNRSMHAVPGVEAAGAPPGFGITAVKVEGFRTAHDAVFSAGPLCALVGEADAGKSNLLAAIRAALDPADAPVTADDAAAGSDGRISIRVELAGGGEFALERAVGGSTVTEGEAAPPVVFMPAEARAGSLLSEAARGSPDPRVEIFRQAFERRPATAASRALSLVDALETCCAHGVAGILLLIEEPELYLRPQAQRYLYRLLREFAGQGNQVIYSTHSPAFLNVSRLEELVFVERLPSTGTRALQPDPVSPAEDFRVLTEFDAARSELFLARAAVLVEGQTEKLVLPFVFSALGYDADREAVSIVECGGKPNIPFFSRICRAIGIPFVVVHDSDRRPSGRLTQADRALNALIVESAGEDHVIVLDPDFEGAAGLTGHKPKHAWREFAKRRADEMPKELVRAAELAVSLAKAPTVGYRST